jgi:hypothetical protein
LFLHDISGVLELAPETGQLCLIVLDLIRHQLGLVGNVEVDLLENLVRHLSLLVVGILMESLQSHQVVLKP